MSLYRVQDQPAVMSREATRQWCAIATRPESSAKISKDFAHRGLFLGTCAGLVVRLGNPEDRP
jgi:hypothetical protein